MALVQRSCSARAADLVQWRSRSGPRAADLAHSKGTDTAIQQKGDDLQPNRLSGHPLRWVCCGLPLVAGELDVLGGAVQESLGLDGVQVLLHAGGVARAGGDDGLQVLDLGIVAADGVLGLAQLVGEDVGEDRVVAAAVHVGEGLGGVLVLAGEDLDDAQVLLGVSGAGLAEEVLGGGEVIVAQGDDPLGVQDVAVIGLHLGECVLGLGELVLAQVQGGEVEPGAVAVELLRGLLVDFLLLGVVLHQGGGAQEGFLVQHVGIVVQELEELF